MLEKFSHIHKSLFISTVFVVGLTACSDSAIDGPVTDNNEGFDSEIGFMGYVEEEGEIISRANTTVTDVTYTAFPDVDFYIYVEGKNKEGVDQKSNIGSYWVQSSTQGMLWPKNQSSKLRWFSRENDHHFWSWTIPWEDRQTYTATTEPVTLNFRNTFIKDSENPDEYWDNGSCLEKFVGALNGPYSYNADGIYIPLQYRHLVSKIQLMSFSIVDNSTGSSYANLKGNFTLLGMPENVTFFPRPVDGDDGSKSAPFVALPENYEYDTEKGVSFAVQNLRAGSSSSSQPYDYFYICPELDFSKLAFKIEIWQRVADSSSPSGYTWIPNTSHGTRGAFYGDFKNVTFTRSTTGSNYDNPEGGDTKILHAGEYMQLVVSINSQGVPTVKVSVSNWSSTQEHQAYQHITPGLYSDGELHDLSDLYDPSKSHSEEERDEYFQMHGNGYTSSDPDDPNYYPGVPEGKGIYHLYGDVALYDSKYALYLGSDYMLDGMGYMIDFYKKNGGYTYKIPKNIRNVYLRCEYWYDSTQEYIVYIDNDGLVWFVNPQTWERTPTGNSLADPKFNNYDYINIGLQYGSLSGTT